MDTIKILKGDIAFTKSPDEVTTYKNGYLVIKDKKILGIYETIPESFQKISIDDYTDQLIIPGFVDLHVHAPQLDQVGLGLDKELMDWLDVYTFKLESRFQDMDYAKEVYNRFVDQLANNGTTRSCIFATIHKESTQLLFERLKEKGLGAYVGKVNMDANGAKYLQESTKESIEDTREIILKYSNDPLVKPIITPRFAPNCTRALLKALGQLANQHNVPVQSHLSENKKEIQWVKKLFPEATSYGDVYNHYGLFGQTPTLMAHGIYLEEEELKLLEKQDVTIVHCPDSNMNIASGMMPARRYLDRGIKIGLGSDVGGGHLLSMSQTIVRAIQNSKMLQTLTGEKALTMSEAFYMATKGGGKFFGKVGSFETGYTFDGLIIDDEKWTKERLTIEERLNRFIYVGDDRNIIIRYINGVDINLK
ncbi:guanine deaminase [Natranaerovirga hydrolytica]|uniref:Guanine deaminase n=1 Tax=Natranaerovirga hydrolytica TaxID=680378 RepID=A0A4R1MYS7_9FIRM|nr:guanine deaminase [Natranaerovirga hydrolytica]TCK97760.1 guanine deaminase [Natranaerovirga hydrolytica]